MLSVPMGAQRAAVVDAGEFGHSISLKGPWLAAAGDDPAWAQPGFDDRGWKVLNPHRPLSEQGFGGTHSVWYRRRVQFRPNGPPMAVYVENLTRNYALYANGERVGGQGGTGVADLDVEHPPMAFAIPQQVIGSGHGSVVLAIHISSGRAGFYNVVPLRESTGLELIDPQEVPKRLSYRLAHDWSEQWALAGFNLIVGLCGLVIWWSLRDQREYLALAIWLLSSVFDIVLTFSVHLGGGGMSLLTFLVLSLRAAHDVGELEFMRLLLHKRQSALWLSLEAACALAHTIGPLLDTGRLPFAAAAFLYYIPPAITTLFVGFMLLRGALRGNRDAPFLLLPLVLWSFTNLYRTADVLLWVLFKVSPPDLPVLHLYSYSVEVASMADLLGLLCLMLIILRRTVRLSREKADLATEVAAAEQVQLLLMARASRPTPGYRVETEYRPMQQVGGDFFLVQPCEEDGSLVAIVGDVSGKGLQAAMRVSMILGVLQREVMGRPEQVLAKLNAALTTQGDLGFTTACCVRLEPDGSFCFANAGHLNPYVEGRELPSEGALPLGMDAEASYPVQCGRLLAGERMVLISDGVVEARSKRGELFGFDRTRALMRQKAAAVVEAAQQFGQEDDITVLALGLA